MTEYVIFSRTRNGGLRAYGRVLNESRAQMHCAKLGNNYEYTSEANYHGMIGRKKYVPLIDYKDSEVELRDGNWYQLARGVRWS